MEKIKGIIDCLKNFINQWTENKEKVETTEELISSLRTVVNAFQSLDCNDHSSDLRIWKNGYLQAEKDYHKQLGKDRQVAYNYGYEQGKLEGEMSRCDKCNYFITVDQAFSDGKKSSENLIYEYALWIFLKHKEIKEDAANSVDEFLIQKKEKEKDL